MAAIKVENVQKSFRVFYDKGRSMKEVVLFRNRRRYENRSVLKDINFSVDKGEAIGIIGENGCGKSTLLKLMTRIIYPDKGRITIEGRVSSLIELGAGFHPDMSGRENIYTNAAIFGLGKKEIDSRLEGIIAFSELEEFIDNPIRTYSSGMYMRLAFSVAINVNADVLLIDEILSVGDANFQEKCHAKLDELKKRGVTIAIVSHDLGTIRNFCDKAIWINNGVVEKYGLPGTVIDQYLEFMSGKRRVQ
ncbi:MAG: ABC transporter ATP-binding protein [Oscillospiraceae bacterium]|nr:ABC transporter ATP-binding protein [Oscillospiraceae bacterium]